MTEAERIASWAERRTSNREVPARRPQGRAGHLSHEEKQAIRLAYLEGGGRVTRLALAAQFNVNRDTVAACLQGQEFEELQQQLEQELEGPRSTASRRTCYPRPTPGSTRSMSLRGKATTGARGISSSTRK